MGKDSIRARYGQNFLRNEFLISVALVGGVFLCALFVKKDINDMLAIFLKDARPGFYTALASIGGSLLGFAITGISILFALSGIPKLAALQKSPYYADIFRIYVNAIKYLAIATVLALVGIFVDTNKDNPCLWIFYLNLWALVISAMRLWRCVWVLRKIIEIVVHNPGKL